MVTAAIGEMTIERGGTINAGEPHAGSGSQAVRPRYIIADKIRLLFYALLLRQ